MDLFPLCSLSVRHRPHVDRHDRPLIELGFDGQTVFLSKIQPDPLIDVPHPIPEPLPDFTCAYP